MLRLFYVIFLNMPSVSGVAYYYFKR